MPSLNYLNMVFVSSFIYNTFSDISAKLEICPSTQWSILLLSFVF